MEEEGRRSEQLWGKVQRGGATHKEGTNEITVERSKYVKSSRGVVQTKELKRFVRLNAKDS